MMKYDFRHFIRTKKERHSAIFGGEVIAAVIAGVASIGIFAAFANSLAIIIQKQYLGIAFFVPKFYDIEGNATSMHAIYLLLQKNVFEWFFIAAFALVLILLATDATKLTKGKAKGMIVKIFGVAILVLILPSIWDIAAVQAERGALWIVNPLYSYDQNEPCGSNAVSVNAYTQNDQKLFDETIDPSVAPILAENVKIADRLAGVFGSYKGIDKDHYACSPNLRMDYLFHRATSGLSAEILLDGPGSLGIFEYLTSSLQGIGFAVFGSVTRTIIVAFVLLTATVVMIGKTLWVMTILSLFPMLAVMSVFPTIGEFADKLIKMLPPLLMTGVITAGLILAGSSAVFQLETAFHDKEQLFGISGFNQSKVIVEERVVDPSSSKRGASTFQPDTVTLSNNVGSVPNSFDDSLIFWFAAIGTLALAGTIPIMMVPALGQFAATAGQAIQTGILAGVQTTSSVVSSGITGAAAAKSAGGGLGKMMKGGMAGGMGGIAGGEVAGSGMGGVFGGGGGGGGVGANLGAHMYGQPMVISQNPAVGPAAMPTGVPSTGLPASNSPLGQGNMGGYQPFQPAHDGRAGNMPMPNRNEGGTQTGLGGAPTFHNNINVVAQISGAGSVKGVGQS